MARVILIALAFFLQMSFSFAGTNAKLPVLPKQAYDKLPILKEEINKHWPSMPIKSSIAAQIEKFRQLGYMPIFITSATIRPYLFRLINSSFPDIMILSFTELPANIEIEFIGKLEV